MAEDPLLFDVVVIGAGPAGAVAAMEVSRLGLKVALIDENRAAGGQVWRAPQVFRDATDRKFPRPGAGEKLRHALAGEKVTEFFEARVWHIEAHGDQYVCLLTKDEKAQTICADILILATGAQERVVPISGWTLPGVMGLAASTALMKGQDLLPGKQIVLAGAGPLLFVAAHEIITRGGTIAAIVDCNRPSDWLLRTFNLALRPDQALLGLGWLREVLWHGIPYLSGCGVYGIKGNCKVEQVRVGRVDRQWKRTQKRISSFDADAVCLGFGLTPANEYAQHLGVELQFDKQQGYWRPIVDRFGLTSRTNLFIVGDAAGVSGALAAQSHAISACERIAQIKGLSSKSGAARKLYNAAENRIAAQLGRAMNALTKPKPGLFADLADDDIFCRCEDVTAGQLDAAINAGNHTLDGLKSVTRCGMGPCGGRFCSDAATRMLSERLNKPLHDFAPVSSRTPFRPLPLADISKDFKYEDLPLSKPSPL